jgi:uncharacterized protein YecT (DUF1311 family)
MKKNESVRNSVEMLEKKQGVKSVGVPPFLSTQEGGGCMTMKMLVVLCGISAMLLAGADFSAAASFDCSKAATKQEKLICGDQQLSAADDDLAKAYRRALESSSDKEGLKKQQQNWIKTERDACQDAPSLLNAYKSRIAALEANIQKSTQEALREANEHFTFQGKPINPRMLKDLLPLLSDKLPGPVAVDLEGGGNRYFAEITVPEKGIVRATWKEEKDELSFQYQHLGVLANGMHVVKTLAVSGGSGAFFDLLLVKFLADTEYTDGGKSRGRLLMMRTGAFALGAGYNGSIKVQPDQISIGPGGAGIREKAKTEVISFK